MRRRQYERLVVDYESYRARQDAALVADKVEELEGDSTVIMDPGDDPSNGSPNP